MLINPENGYSIRNRDNNITVNKFVNTLDYSLDSMKVAETYEKVYRKKDFQLVVGNKHCTQNVVNVKYNYSYKEFNKVQKNTYVKAGHTYYDCDINDCLGFQDEELIVVQTEKPVYSPCYNLNSDYFYYDEIDKMYHAKNIPTIMDTSQLREYSYLNGFKCDGKDFVRYKRSGGSSRVGKCLFVNKPLSKRMQKWDKCGLSIKEGDAIDLAAYEAYIALPMSSIIDTVEILPENILIIDDYNSKFKDEVVAVEVADNKLISQPKTIDIENNIWDGQSLGDVSLFGKYKNKGMLLLRNQFFKTCMFNTNLQQWFADNNISDVSQLNGFTLAQSIKDIKLITTPSSIKYLKFGTLEQWLKNVDCTFGIVKYEKPTHFFDGRMVQTHYQLLNTLQLSYGEVEELLSQSLDYIDTIRNDVDVLRHHIKYPFSGMDDVPLLSKNEIVFKMLGINNDFSKTKLYYDFRADLIKSLVEQLRDGRILVHGNYSTLFGNGVEMLKHTIYQFDGTTELQGNEIHSTKFTYGQTILGSRSPHITMGNIALLSNKRSDMYDKYFNLTNEIVCVNSCGSNILQRLNGSDFDSDTLLLTDNPILLDAATKNYNRFLVPTNLVQATKTKRYYTVEHQVDLDIKTSENLIGEIVNLSQLLNSVFWDRYNRGETLDELMDLYYDICKLAVLSGIEIDKAKKEFPIDSAYEIKALKMKYQITKTNSKGIKQSVKPFFFKRITLNNGYKLNHKTHYQYFDTTMDYLQRIINLYRKRCQRRKKNVNSTFLPFVDILKSPNISKRSIDKHKAYYYEQRDRIINLVRETRSNVQKLYIDYNLKSKDDKLIVRKQVAEEKQNCIDYINNLVSSEATMYLLLQSISDNPNQPISRFVFEILFGSPNKTFFTMIKNSQENLYKLKEDKFGNIKLYDYLYLKDKCQ